MSELLLEEQAVWDAQNFDREVGYEGLSFRDEKVNHIQLHVAYAALKLVRNDFTVALSEVAPDLAICRSQLMNEFAIEPARVLAADYRPAGNMDNVLKQAVLANGLLAKYVERLQVDDVVSWPASNIELAASYLHVAARSIVDYYRPSQDSDALLTEMHKQRLETLARESLSDPLIEAVAASTTDTDN